MIWDPAAFTIAVIGVFLAGVSKAGFGSGASFLATPLLAVFVPPSVALAVLLPVLMAIDLASLRPYWRRWQPEAAVLLCIGALPGVVIAALVLPGQRSGPHPAVDRGHRAWFSGLPDRAASGGSDRIGLAGAALAGADGRGDCRFHQLRLPCRRPARLGLSAAPRDDQDRVSGHHRAGVLAGQHRQAGRLYCPRHVRCQPAGMVGGPDPLRAAGRLGRAEGTPGGARGAVFRRHLRASGRCRRQARDRRSDLSGRARKPRAPPAAAVRRLRRARVFRRASRRPGRWRPGRSVRSAW